MLRVCNGCKDVLVRDQDGASRPLAQNGASLTSFVLTEHTLVYHTFRFAVVWILEKSTYSSVW